jgi:hypothetical protein
MKKPAVVVVDADQENGQEFCIVLQGLNYDAVPLTSLEELDQHIRKNQDFTVILNLDSVSADQHFFRAVKKRHPRLYPNSSTIRGWRKWWGRTCMPAWSGLWIWRSLTTG